MEFSGEFSISSPRSAQGQPEKKNQWNFRENFLRLLPDWPGTEGVKRGYFPIWAGCPSPMVGLDTPTNRRNLTRGRGRQPVGRYTHAA